MSALVIATRVIERTSADLMTAVFGECTGRCWTPSSRDPLLWVSDDGEVVSLYKKRARRLKPILSGQYHAVGVGAGHKTTHIHRLMAESWFGPAPFERAVVRHLDGDRFNNRIGNLAWGSHSENSEDQLRHGTRMFGERNPMAKLTRDAVDQMRDLRAAGRTFKSIASQFGVSPMTAHRAITGASWK